MEVKSLALKAQARFSERSRCQGRQAGPSACPKVLRKSALKLLEKWQYIPMTKKLENKAQIF